MLRLESIGGTACEGVIHTLFVLICASLTSSSVDIFKQPLPFSIFLSLQTHNTHKWLQIALG